MQNTVTTVYDGAEVISNKNTLASAPDLIFIDATFSFAKPSSELDSSSCIYRASTNPKDSFGIRRQDKDHLSSNSCIDLLELQRHREAH
jgi:hypothetical protein